MGLLLKFAGSTGNKGLIKKGACLLLPFGAIKAVFYLFKKQHGIDKSDLTLNFLHAPPHWIADLFMTIKILLSNLFLSGNWSIGWFVLGVLMLLCSAEQKQFHVRFLKATLGFYLVCFVLIAMFTHNFISASLGVGRDSDSRLILHFFWICPVLIGFLIRDTLSGRQRSHGL